MRAKPSLLILLAVAASGQIALGWTGPMLYNVCNSAPQAAGTVVVNLDAPDVINPTDAVSATLFYSTDNQATWQPVPMTVSGAPGYESTLVASFTIPPSGTVYYYVRAQNETNWGTEGPLNSGNVWPVTDNWLADLANEPTGDMENNPDGNFLDLTSVAMSYSDTYFYGRLTNNYNSWPLDGGWLGPWYLYTVGFRNADAYTLDTFAYAMTYADAPLGNGSGLYEVNAFTSAFTQIGDIDVSTSGNRLVMRGLISDLTSRRGFQPWPNTGGFICSAKGDTRSANAVLQSWRHDSTNSARFYIDKSPGFVVGANTPPELTVPRVFPRFGDDTSHFRFTVTYTDADTNLAVLHAVVVDGETTSLRPNHHRYYEGVNYSATETGFSTGTHRFHFAFDDGMGVVESPEDTFVVSGGTGVAEGPTPSGSGFTLEARPNPFTNVVELRGRVRSRVLHIFDHCGKLVARLQQASEGAVVRWDGTDDAGNRLPGGVYFCREDGGPLRRLLVKLGK